MSLIGSLIVWIVAIGLLGGVLAVSAARLFGALQARAARQLFVVGGVVGLAAGAVGAHVVARAIGVAGAATPACPNVTLPVDPAAAATRAQLITCAQGLTFGTDEHGAGDMQFLDLQDPATGQAVPGGPLAAIFPQVAIHRNSSRALASGRIVARIWVDETVDAGYPKLGLGPGWNYVWIDGTNPPGGQAKQPRDSTAQRPRLGLQGPAQRGVYRAIIVPQNTAYDVVARPVDYYEHRGKPWWMTAWPRAMARWTFWPDDADAWMNCTKHGCCDIGEA